MAGTIANNFSYAVVDGNLVVVNGLKTPSVLSFDGLNDPDVLGLIAASAALSISSVPWKGPIALDMLICKQNGKPLIN